MLQPIFARTAVALATTLALILTLSSVPASGATSAQPAMGPLTIHPDNPRYFADGAGRPVYLTGSHTWDNLVDMGQSDPPEPFAFTDYLDRLEKYGHNFIRMWAWELTRWDTQANGALSLHKANLHVAPHPWRRTGSEKALDGKPKFDLDQFNPDYFARLRERVEAAGQRGIYVSVMLFEGWGLQRMEKAWEAHPFHKDNNANGIDGDTDGDGKGLETHTLANPAVLAVQERLARKVFDTVADLDNVLFEITNESHSGSTEWQTHFIRLLQEYGTSKGRRHPVGMTFQYQGGSNQTLFESPADWISPNASGGYRDNPPAADGKKIILSDTDHLWGVGGNRAWVWKSFTRGLHPIFMDPWKGAVLGKPDDPQFEPVRVAMGHTLGFARRMDLARALPSTILSSTGFCLGEQGRQYLIYAPEGGSIEVDLGPAGEGLWAPEWLDPQTNDRYQDRLLRVSGNRAFLAPFEGEAVLFLLNVPEPEPQGDGE